MASGLDEERVAKPEDLEPPICRRQGHRLRQEQSAKSLVLGSTAIRYLRNIFIRSFDVGRLGTKAKPKLAPTSEGVIPHRAVAVALETRLKVDL